MRKNEDMLAKTVKEAAYEFYGRGFSDGYQAARMAIEALVEAWRLEPEAYDLESALKVLDASKEKAVEMMGTPDIDVVPVKVHATSDTTH